MTDSIVVRCVEHLAAVRAFAADHGLGPALERTLEYVRTYGGATPTAVELYSDTSFGRRYDFVAEIFLANPDRTHWMTMGIVLDARKGEWSTHT